MITGNALGDTGEPSLFRIRHVCMQLVNFNYVKGVCSCMVGGLSDREEWFTVGGSLLS